MVTIGFLLSALAGTADGVRAVEVGVADSATCARYSDGTVACWGVLADLATTPAPVSGLQGIVDLDLGRHHACAVRDDGTVWCWGKNGDGQLGDGTTEDRADPVRSVGITDAVEVVADRVHTCARRRGGSVMCWGSAGFIGDGALETRLVPTRTRRLTKAARLVAGDDLTCAIREDRTVWCWGFNTTGLLNPRLGPVRTPMPSKNMYGVEDLALGWRHGCVALDNAPKTGDQPERRSKGVVYCFGDDSRGQLGDQEVPNEAWCHAKEREVTCTWWPPRRDRSDDRRAIAFDREYRPPPDPPQEKRVFPTRPGAVVADAMRVTSLVASEWRSCGLREGRGVLCWGRGFVTPEWSFHRPSIIAGTEGTVQVAVEERNGCAVMGDGSIRCWGDNRAGQLGDGTTEARAEAHEVR